MRPAPAGDRQVSSTLSAVGSSTCSPGGERGPGHGTARPLPPRGAVSAVLRTCKFVRRDRDVVDYCRAGHHLGRCLRSARWPATGTLAGDPRATPAQVGAEIGLEHNLGDRRWRRAGPGALALLSSTARARGENHQRTQRARSDGVLRFVGDPARPRRRPRSTRETSSTRKCNWWSAISAG